MKQLVFSYCVLIALLACPSLSRSQEPANELRGAWQATSISRAGKEAPADAVKLMRMTFLKDALLVRSNFQDEREVSCTYKIDAEKSPKHFEFLPPGEKNPVLGIYRIESGKLEIAMRNANQPKGRPESFDATKDDSIVLMKFERLESKPRTP